jgi:hypothetical protein
MIWRKKPKVDPDELCAQAEAATTQLLEQQEQVNAVTGYLERRKMQNGFGHDFEYTLTPRGIR